MSFLEQLFFGNVDPQCRESLHPKAMRKAQQTLSSLEQTLMDQLPTPQKELFVQYTDACLGNPKCTERSGLLCVWFPPRSPDGAGCL